METPCATSAAAILTPKSGYGYGLGFLPECCRDVSDATASIHPGFMQEGFGLRIWYSVHGLRQGVAFAVVGRRPWAEAVAGVRRFLVEAEAEA